MSYRDSAIDQRPRLLRLTIKDGTAEREQEIERRPPPDPKTWPPNVDPRLPQHQLWRSLLRKRWGTHIMWSWLAHGLIATVVVTVIAFRANSPLRAFLTGLAVLAVYGVTTVLPAWIWLRRRLQQAPAVLKQWNAQGGWKLDSLTPLEQSQAYFAEAGRELFNDLRARVGMPLVPESLDQNDMNKSLAGEYLTIHKFLHKDTRFRDSTERLVAVIMEMQRILRTMYHRIQATESMLETDTLDLETRDQRRLNELYTEFCETTRLRIEQDTPATKEAPREALPAQHEATFTRGATSHRKT